MSILSCLYYLNNIDIIIHNDSIKSDNLRLFGFLKRKRTINIYIYIYIYINFFTALKSNF